MSSYDIDDLVFALHEVLMVLRGWCSPEELSRLVLPALGRKRISGPLVEDVKQVCRELEEDGFIVSDIGEEGDVRFLHRGTHFDECCFLVSLTDQEREGKHLVPGHRFLPFLAPGVFPGDAEVLYEGQPLSSTTVSMTMEDVYIYLSLFGTHGAAQYVGFEFAEHSDEEPGDVRPDKPIDFTCLDLRRVFADVGDAAEFRVRCLNGIHGLFEIEEVYSPGRTLDFRKSTEGVEQLDRAFEQVFEMFGPELPLPRQILNAYVRMGDWFFEDPPFHLGGYFSMSRKVGFFPYGTDVRLWRRGEELAPPENDPLTEFMKEYGDLDEMLDNLEEEDDTEIPWKEPEPKAPDMTLYTLKVALDDNRRIYRMIRIHGENTWEELHMAIFAAFEREEEHLYTFFLTRKQTRSQRARYNAPRIECPYGGVSEDAWVSDEVTVGESELRVEDRLYYIFDWGDEWWHEITVLAVDSAPGSDPDDYPRITGESGEAPPQYPYSP